MSKLIGKEGEEDLLLVEGFDGRGFDGFGALDELVRLRHVEDEFVTDKLGGSVVDIGAEEGLGTKVPRTRRRGTRHTS